MPLSKARQSKYMRDYRKHLKLTNALKLAIRYNKAPSKPAVIPNLDADSNLVPDYW